MRFHLTLKSSNVKTGPIPVSTSPESTCPPSCPLKGKGCYADGGPLRIHWNKVSQGERGTSYADFCNMIKMLQEGQLWRHNQCGDLVPLVDIQGDTIVDAKLIDKSRLGQLVNANKGRHGYTYTHYEVIGSSAAAIWNRNAIRAANGAGFTINLSADDLKEADEMVELGISPVTVMLSSDVQLNVVTPKGRKVVVCPVATGALESCAVCKLCAKSTRKSIIGFPAHGAKRKAIDRFLKIME